MALSYPYALSVLADLLEIEEVIWDIRRSDELSGTADARVWQAELADPLWSGDVVLASNYHHILKRVGALVRKLYGAQESFLLYDPTSLYPFTDPKGTALGASVVQVKTVGVNRKSLSLKGLPVGYGLTPGDKMQILYASGGSRNFFCEVSETVSANVSNETVEFEIFPHVPTGLAADDLVLLKRPACKVFVMPDTFKPGRARGAMTEGASFKVMERRR